MKSLDQLLKEVSGAAHDGSRTADVPIHRVTDDSREMGTGALFVAIQGTNQDGHDRIAEAVRNGAAAVVVEREVPDPGVPAIRVENSRRALAELSSAWYGHPARRLKLVGITGTLGKTSVLSMLESALRTAGIPLATIGSLGLRLPDSREETGHTVPGPRIIHEALARAEQEGARLVAMEVTSHALSQDRVHGLAFELGVFTNLVPLEHMEYHGSFEEYAAAKARFFDHVRPGRPVVYSAGDRVLQAMIAEREVKGVGCGRDPGAAVQIGSMRTAPDRTRFTLAYHEALPCPGASVAAPVEVPIELRLMGRANTNNAGLAATAAFCLGAEVPAVQAALSAMEAPTRRMKVVLASPVLVIDDTVGHPDSITAVFEVAESLPHGRLHVVFAIRGQRGPTINRGDAETLAVWARRVEIASLLVTPSRDTADERNTVAEEERAAFVSLLKEAGCEYREHERLSDAIDEVVTTAEEGDLVLLLGAQGMDAGAELIVRRLRE